ncbi:MAG TPA: hypothetical protein VGL22_06350 [Terracidiphilus sp.]
MRRKKLLTFGCAVGILACGACFLPPPRPGPPRPPRPRPHVNLQGSNRMRVTVRNNVGAQGIDAAMLERCVADSINSRRAVAIPVAVGGGEAQEGDAVLAITMEKASAAPEQQQLSPGSTTWDFDVTLSTALTRADGVWLWSEVNGVYQGVVVTAARVSAWDSSSFAARARYYICDPVAVHMLSHGQ